MSDRAGRLDGALPRMRMRSEVQLATAPVGYVRVELGRREVRMPEHLLDAAEVGSTLEQVRGEAVPEQVRVNAARLETGLLGQPADDQERACTGERPAARIEEELGPAPGVEVRPAVREVAPERVRGLPSDRDDPLLVPLADAADEPLLQ